MSDSGWGPDRWWRVLLADGSVWAETSSETEARTIHAEQPGSLLQRHEVRKFERWTDVSPTTTEDSSQP